MVYVYNIPSGQIIGGFESAEDAHAYGGALYSLLPSKEAIDQYLLTHEPRNGRLFIVEQAREFWGRCIPYICEPIREQRSLKRHGGKWWLYMKMTE